MHLCVRLACCFWASVGVYKPARDCCRHSGTLTHPLSSFALSVRAARKASWLKNWKRASAAARLLFVDLHVAALDAALTREDLNYECFAARGWRLSPPP